MTNQTILAVDDDDLTGLLKSMNLLDAIQSGEAFCSSCNSPITLQNIQFIIPHSNLAIDLICNRPTCSDNLPALTNNR